MAKKDLGIEIDELRVRKLLVQTAIVQISL